MPEKHLYADVFTSMPAKWHVASLPDVVDFQEGPGILARDFQETGIPLLRLKSIQSRFATLAGVDYLDPSQVKERWSHFMLEQGDLLISTSATIGIVSEVDATTRGSIPYTGIIRMRPKTPTLDREFLRHFLKSSLFSTQAERMASGSVMRHFGPTHLRQMAVAMPPIEEQRAIASVLDVLDDKIEVNSKMSATLDAMARALFTSWFVTFENIPSSLALDANRVERKTTIPTPSVGAHVDLPAGWTIAPLSELLSLQYGKALTEQFRVPGPVAVMGCTGQIGWHNEKLSRGPGVIVGRKGANAGAIAWTDDDFWVIDTAFYVAPKHAEHLPFIYYALQFQNLSLLHADSAVPGINRQAVHHRTQVVPPGDVISHFSDVVRPMQQRMTSSARQNRVLTELRDALLPKLMSGTLGAREAEQVLEKSV